MSLAGATDREHRSSNEPPEFSEMVSDDRVILTLDAGGTNFRFSAIQGGRVVVPLLLRPSNGHDLELCLAGISDGFNTVRERCPRPPAAISFAFPAPADYPAGVIGDLSNLPAFRGGVPLGAILEERFGIPVFINNDGDLFAYGEAIAGLLPHTNGLLRQAGSPKQYHNLLGLTLGTGFGGGIVRNGRPFLGDNSMAAEVWLLRNKLRPETGAEETASIRGIRQAYAEFSGTAFEAAPDPREIFRIGVGEVEGHREAARAAYARFGEVVGDALGNALTLIDGLAVIGGGLSGAAPLFMPALLNELNACYTDGSGTRWRRLTARVFNLDDAAEQAAFLRGDLHTLPVPGSSRTVSYDRLQRVGIGVSRLGTSQAVAIGAYAFAVARLKRG